jgi:hypothetical protein
MNPLEPLGVPPRGRVPLPADWLVAGSGALWAGGGQFFARISPNDGTIELLTLGLPPSRHGIVSRPLYASGWLWFADGDDAVRVDPSDGSISGKVMVPSDRPQAWNAGVRLIGGNQVVVGAGEFRESFTRIDPGSLETTRVRFQGTLNPAAVAAEAVWAIDRVAPELAALDLETGEELYRVDLGGQVVTLSATADTVWAAIRDARFGLHPSADRGPEFRGEHWVIGDGRGRTGPGRIVRIDAARRALVDDIEVPMSTFSLFVLPDGALAVGSMVGRRDLELSPQESEKRIALVLTHDGIASELPSESLGDTGTVTAVALLEGSAWLLTSLLVDDCIKPARSCVSSSLRWMSTSWRTSPLSRSPLSFLRSPTRRPRTSSSGD